MYAVLFCIFCIFMVYTDHVIRRREPSIQIIIITSDDVQRIIEKESHGSQKSFAKKDKQNKKTVSSGSNESKNF